MSIDWFGKNAKKREKLLIKKVEKEEKARVHAHNEKMEKDHPCKDRDEHCWHYLDSCVDFMWRFKDYCCFCDGIKTRNGKKISAITLANEHGKFLSTRRRGK